MKWFVLFISLTATSLTHGAWSVQQKQLIATIKPTTEESTWMRINWRTNLWQARKEAAKSGKPIYLWEMDGHPLGCT